MDQEHQKLGESLPDVLLELSAHISGVLEKHYGPSVRFALVLAFKGEPGTTTIRRLANCEFDIARNLFRCAASIPATNLKVQEFH